MKVYRFLLPYLPYTKRCKTLLKKLLLIIYLIPILIIAQEKKDAETQNNWYKKAEMELNGRQIKRAFSSYRFAYELLPESKTGKKSLKLSDSLKTTLRKKLIRNIEGNWKIKIFSKIKTEKDKKHYEKLGKFLRITKDSIFYYTSKRNLKANRSYYQFENKIL